MSVERTRAVVRVQGWQLGQLLSGGLYRAYVTGIRHDVIREHFDVVIASPDFDEVPEGCEPPIDVAIERVLRQACEHDAVGEVITQLGTIDRNDLAGNLVEVRELVAHPSLECLGVLDSPQPITDDTREACVRLAALLTAVATMTLTDDQAATYIALDRALAPLEQAATRVDDDD